MRALERRREEKLIYSEFLAHRHAKRAIDRSDHEEIKRLGFDLLRRDYNSPIPDMADLSPSYWEQVSTLPGVDLNESAALELLETVFSKYVPEFRLQFPHLTPTPGADPAAFFLLNGVYMAGDAHVLYSLIRHRKPQRIIEIGSGRSTLVMAAACLKNQEESGTKPRLTAIEPYPAPFLERGFPGLDELLKKKVQDVGFEIFESLRAGDILFIDSSHVLRAGNDVEFEYLELLPRLPSGVLVHIHDISLPKRYPKVYFDQRIYWNEQYLLQAFLAFNTRFRVLWPGTHMYMKYPEKVLEVFPEIRAMREKYPQAEPSAFWMESK